MMGSNLGSVGAIWPGDGNGDLADEWRMHRRRPHAVGTRAATRPLCSSDGHEAQRYGGAGRGAGEERTACTSGADHMVSLLPHPACSRHPARSRMWSVRIRRRRVETRTALPLLPARAVSAVSPHFRFRRTRQCEQCWRCRQRHSERKRAHGSEAPRFSFRESTYTAFGLASHSANLVMRASVTRSSVGLACASPFFFCFPSFPARFAIAPAR
jgi:hypothetical protein